MQYHLLIVTINRNYKIVQYQMNHLFNNNIHNGSQTTMNTKTHRKSTENGQTLSHISWNQQAPNCFCCWSKVSSILTGMNTFTMNKIRALHKATSIKWDLDNDLLKRQRLQRSENSAWSCKITRITTINNQTNVPIKTVCLTLIRLTCTICNYAINK